MEVYGVDLNPEFSPDAVSAGAIVLLSSDSFTDVDEFVHADPIEFQEVSSPDSFHPQHAPESPTLISLTAGLAPAKRLYVKPNSVDVDTKTKFATLRNIPHFKIRGRSKFLDKRRKKHTLKSKEPGLMPTVDLISGNITDSYRLLNRAKRLNFGHSSDDDDIFEDIDSMSSDPDDNDSYYDGCSDIDMPTDTTYSDLHPNNPLQLELFPKTLYSLFSDSSLDEAGTDISDTSDMDKTTFNSNDGRNDHNTNFDTLRLDTPPDESTQDPDLYMIESLDSLSKTDIFVLAAKNIKMSRDHYQLVGSRGGEGTPTERGFNVEYLSDGVTDMDISDRPEDSPTPFEEIVKLTRINRGMNEGNPLADSPTGTQLEGNFAGIYNDQEYMAAAINENKGDIAKQTTLKVSPKGVLRGDDSHLISMNDKRLDVALNGSKTEKVDLIGEEYKDKIVSSVETNEADNGVVRNIGSVTATDDANVFYGRLGNKQYGHTEKRLTESVIANNLHFKTGSRKAHDAERAHQDADPAFEDSQGSYSERSAECGNESPYATEITAENAVDVDMSEESIIYEPHSDFKYEIAEYEDIDNQQEEVDESQRNVDFNDKSKTAIPNVNNDDMPQENVPENGQYEEYSLFPEDESDIPDDVAGDEDADLLEGVDEQDVNVTHGHTPGVYVNPDQMTIKEITSDHEEQTLIRSMSGHVYSADHSKSEVYHMSQSQPDTMHTRSKHFFRNTAGKALPASPSVVLDSHYVGCMEMDGPAGISSYSLVHRMPLENRGHATMSVSGDRDMKMSMSNLSTDLVDTNFAEYPENGSATGSSAESGLIDVIGEPGRISKYPFAGIRVRGEKAPRMVDDEISIDGADRYPAWYVNPSTGDREFDPGPLAVDFYCNICQRSLPLGTFRLRCVECADFDLCITCACQGADRNTHKNDHKYIPMSPNLFCLFGDWTADEELLLLEGISKFGFGNWNQVAEMVNRISTRHKSSTECENHYNEYYIHSKTSPFPDLSRMRTFVRDPLDREKLYKLMATLREDHNNDKNKQCDIPDPRMFDESLHHMDLIPPAADIANSGAPLVKFFQHFNGYNLYRDELESEFNNDAELLIKDLEFEPWDTPVEIDFKLKLVEMYNSMLDDRVRHKRLLIHRFWSDYPLRERGFLSMDHIERAAYWRLAPLMRLQSEEEHLRLTKLVVAKVEIEKRLRIVNIWHSLGIRTLDDLERLDVNKIPNSHYYGSTEEMHPLSVKLLGNGELIESEMNDLTEQLNNRFCNEFSLTRTQMDSILSDLGKLNGGEPYHLKDEVNVIPSWDVCFQDGAVVEENKTDFQLPPLMMESIPRPDWHPRIVIEKDFFVNYPFVKVEELEFDSLSDSEVKQSHTVEGSGSCIYFTQFQPSLRARPQKCIPKRKRPVHQSEGIKCLQLRRQ